MKEITKIAVPSVESEDYNKEKSVWKNGKYIALDEGGYVTYYIGHESESIAQRTEDGKLVEQAVVTSAFAVRVAKPVTRDAAINAAEMEAYSLKDAMAVASFNASLARKARGNADDAEVKGHDEFIAWVKDELTKIGV